MSEQASRHRLSGRPEAPWALRAGLAGALAVSVLTVKSILDSASSTAAVGFLLLPFIAAIAMIVSAVWGLAAGCVYLSLRGAQRYPPGVLLAAWVLAVAGPATLGWETWRGLALERAVAEVRQAHAAELPALMARSRFGTDRFFLGAIVQRRDTGADVLDRIAALDDPALYEPMGSLWDVMGENRKGIAVMRFVANHPHTRPGTLARLADGPRADTLRHELARNPNTPPDVLARYFDSTDPFVEWGLALNPRTPPAVLERLSRSADRYTRMNLVRNPSTPRPVLERLASDPDPHLARVAQQALEDRARSR